MSGVYATVLFRKTFDVGDTGRVTAILRNVATEVRETRRGRHWDFVVANCAGSLDIIPTTALMVDYVDLLTALKLNLEDVPEAAELAFACRGESVQLACEALRTLLAREFDGLDCGSRW